MDHPICENFMTSTTTKCSNCLSLREGIADLPGEDHLQVLMKKTHQISLILNIIIYMCNFKINHIAQIKIFFIYKTICTLTRP